LVQSMFGPSARASEILGRAFQSDPQFEYLLPQPQARRIVTPGLFGLVAGYTAAYGALDLSPESQGVACWLRPGHTVPWRRHFLWLSLSRWRSWRALLRLGWSGFQRLLALTAYADEQHHYAAPTAHWYLWAIGVDPDYQRQGIGGRLLQLGLERADADHLPCYLETNNVLNLMLCQKHGFKMVSRGQPAGHELTFWTMRRDAQ
jgi:ribosomal protein S18 acetylase RimI-like enzyme